MKIIYISIFPEIFESFLSTSLIEKAQEVDILEFLCVDPRDFCRDKHKQVDDEPYGGGAGLVMKAQPVIDAIQDSVDMLKSKDELSSGEFAVIMPGPSTKVFSQKMAHDFTQYKALIFVAGRYEGIDYRCNLWARDQFDNDFYECSLGQFVTLGGETPAMVMTESIVRLLPGVLGDTTSRQNESYRPEAGGDNIEHPHYTRPQTVEGYNVPEILLSGNHAKIEEWRGKMGE